MACFAMGIVTRYPSTNSLNAVQKTYPLHLWLFKQQKAETLQRANEDSRAGKWLLLDAILLLNAPVSGKPVAASVSEAHIPLDKLRK